MKTRYTIIEPGPLRPEDLVRLTWVDVEFREAKAQPERALLWEADEGARIMLTEFHRVLDPLFADWVGQDGRNPHGWERVAVNSFKGQADMFVGDGSALPTVPVNEGATLIYWTATILHQIDREGLGLKTYEDMQKLALIRAGKALRGEELTSGLYRETPRIHGRAVLFDDRVWF